MHQLLDLCIYTVLPSDGCGSDFPNFGEKIERLKGEQFMSMESFFLLLFALFRNIQTIFKDL